MNREAVTVGLCSVDGQCTLPAAGAEGGNPGAHTGTGHVPPPDLVLRDGAGDDDLRQGLGAVFPHSALHRLGHFAAHGGRGFLTFAVSEADHRRKHLTLTQKAHDAHAQTVKIIQESDALLTARMTEAEAAEFRRLLRLAAGKRGRGCKGDVPTISQGGMMIC